MRDVALLAVLISVIAHAYGQAHFAITVIDFPIYSFATIYIRVTALDDFGNINTDFSGDVTMSATDPSFLNNSPINVTAGTGTKSGFGLRTAGLQTIFATDGTLNGQVDVEVLPGPMAGLSYRLPYPIFVKQPFTFSVYARDLIGNVVPSYTGTLHFTSTAPDATLPADVTLVNGDSGPLLVTFSTAGGPKITAQDTLDPSISVTTGEIPVWNVPATHLSLVVSSNPVIAGANLDLTVNAVDDLGDIDTSSYDDIRFTCTDPAFVDSGALLLSAGTITGNSYALKTVGTQTITASGLTTGLSGQIDVVVLPGPIASFTVTVPASAAVGVATTVSATALDAFGNIVTSYTGTVHFSSPDASAILPADLNLVKGVSGLLDVTFNTAGAQTITAEDTAASSISGTSDTITVVTGGTGGGDPAFVGFMGQRFHFYGKPHKCFHIYSDPYLSVNSHFTIANANRGKGTIMDAFLIHWENHSIAFDVRSRIQDLTLVQLLLDGSELLLRKGRETYLDECVSAIFDSRKLYVRTPLHKIRIDWREERTDHINGSYFNIQVSAPLAEKGLRFGGVLGQTAPVQPTNKVAAISKRFEDFVISDDMRSVKARTSTFDARALLCAAVATQPPVTAEVAHDHKAVGRGV